MTTDRIDILINARNQTSGAFNQVRQELSGLNNFASTLSSGLAGIGAVAGVGAVVAGLQQIGSAIDEVSRRGAIFEQLGSVLDDYAESVNQAGNAFVEAGRKASAGTIADYELILNANRAIQFEVAQTSDQYAKLIELATALGRAQGISDTQALEFLTTGIARESRLILDNLGLIVDLDEATSKYAATLGKAANELTQAERKQAILNEAFRQGETAIKANRDASDSAATNFERMDAAIQNAKDNLGALFAPAVAVVAASIADAAASAAEGLNQVGKNLDVGDAYARLQLLRDVAEGTAEALQMEEANKGTPLFDQTKIFELTTRNRQAQEQLAAATAEYYAALRTLYPAQQQGAEAMNRTSVEAEAQANALRRNAEAAASASANFDPLNVATNSLARETNILNQELSGTPGWMRQMAREAVAAGGSLLDVAADVRQLKADLDRLESAKGAARNAIIRAAVGVSEIVGDGRALQLAQQQIGAMEFGISALNQQLKDGTISQAEFDYELAKLNERFTGTFDAITEADRAAKQFAREGMSEAKRAAKEAAAEAEAAFNSLKGTVQGVLQGALDPGVGVDVDSLLKDGVDLRIGDNKFRQPTPDELLLPRADDVNEAARRLADVAVNGWKSPWIEYLQTAFPDLFANAFAPGEDIRKNAALVLRDFEDGLRPELLDKDKAKERVKRILLGEANVAQLAQEIAAELSAEFGGSISLGKIQATANAALGVDGGGTEQLAQSLTGAANEATGQLTGAGATFRSDIQTAVGEFRAAVTEADTQLGATLTGTTTNIAAQLTSVGKTFRDGIVSALDGVGEVVAIALDKQFRAENNLKTVTDAGRANGEAWSSGFLVAMDSLSSQVLEKLATLVGPYVETIQARNATLNGAN